MESKAGLEAHTRPTPERSDRAAAPSSPAVVRSEGSQTGWAAGTPETLAGRPEVRPAKTPEQQADQEFVAALARRCLSGDQGAWADLVGREHRRVYALCFRFTGSRTDAEDVTQDVFLKVYRNLSSFDPAKGSFATWITTLTRNLLVDGFRRSRMERATDSLDASCGPEEEGPTPLDRLADERPNQEQSLGRLELKVRVQRALGELSPDLREAVVLRDLQELDYKEIAQVLGIPEGTVKSRISRGRAELGRVLQRQEGQVM